ncbi:hypothetical protein GGX14DRAFT_555269 [Mycena pura]|uniref:Uncharacterized protein n=1 Tax=Mycena pura TaxID=153505 RepID=A0AAD7E3H0_9AGAR|nr:hypothetical protein GGX14DRAFT_555269 [Mycena pura]
MDIEAERAFCSNFACCGIPLRDLHALFDHLETSQDSHQDHDALSPLSLSSTSFFPDTLSTSFSLLQKAETGLSQLPPLPPASPPISDCSSASSATSDSSATSSFDSPVPTVFRDQEPHAVIATPVSALATKRPDQPLAWMVPYAPVPLRPSQPAPPDGPSTVAANPSVLVPVSSVYGLPPATTLLRPSPSPQPTPYPPPPAAALGKTKAKRQVTSNARAAATSTYLSTLGCRLYDTTTDAPRASGADASAFERTAETTHEPMDRSDPGGLAGAPAPAAPHRLPPADHTPGVPLRQGARALALPSRARAAPDSLADVTPGIDKRASTRFVGYPNGLKYHLEKGACVTASGALCPVDAPLAPAASRPPAGAAAAAGSTVRPAATTWRPSLRKSARLASSAGRASPAPAPSSSSPGASRSPAHAASPASDSDSDADAD